MLMAKKNNFMTRKNIGIALLIALVLMFVPIPLISGKTIAAILIFIIAIYELFF